MTRPPGEVTQLLLEWRKGDTRALEKLMPLVYEELHRLAHRYMAAERPDHTLQTTALVNEVYLRLVDQNDMQWQNHAHFFAVAAQAMRRILVDHVRTRDAAKRGGGAPKASPEDVALVTPKHAPELIALDEALSELAGLDQRKSQVVELRYFGGMSSEETAEVLGVSAVTAMREWGAAKAWVFRAISQGQAG